MKYLDKDGDTWEEAEDGTLHIVTARAPADVGLTATRELADVKYGPLRPVADDTPVEPQNAPSATLPSITDVIDRAAIFQSAHALVTGLTWSDDEKPSVYDVLQVAKWLEGEE